MGIDTMKTRIAGLLALLVFVVGTAFGYDINERRFIREGMSEGEVVTKIGPPDRETAMTGSEGVVTQKQWFYFPAPGDSQTLTIITILSGQVTAVERRISR